MSDEVSLKIGGKIYSGWLSATVTLSMESLAGSFNLEVTDNWVGQALPWPIIPGNSAKILVNGQTVITGWVDEVNATIDGTSRSIRVSGRDLASDLVDCSVDGQAAEFRNISLEKLASQLATPFGITVNKKTSTGTPLLQARPDLGASVYETLEKYARSRGVLLISNGTGEIDIIAAGSSRSSTSLVEGQNVLSASAQFNGKERFSKYTVKTQIAQETENTLGYFVVGVAEDVGVLRYRPWVSAPEAGLETVNSMTRASWEAITRAARSQEVTATVEGWTQGNGQLWVLNQLIKVQIPSVGIDDDMLISEVTFSLDGDTGTVTTLKLKRKDAFIPVSKVSKADLWAALFTENTSTR